MRTCVFSLVDEGDEVVTVVDLEKPGLFGGPQGDRLTGKGFSNLIEDVFQ